MTFKTWISKYKTISAPINDLAKDIALDKNFPKSNSRKTLLDYLINHGCKNGVPEAFEEAFNLYLKDCHQ